MSWEEFLLEFVRSAASWAWGRSDLTNGQVWALQRYNNSLRGVVSWEGVVNGRIST
jgi:hypothetical protein